MIYLNLFRVANFTIMSEMLLGLLLAFSLTFLEVTFIDWDLVLVLYKEWQVWHLIIETTRR